MDKDIFQREPFDRRSAWSWLIQNAAFADGDGLARGQLRVSMRFMAKAWKWQEPKVRRFILATQQRRMIVCVTDAGKSLITICNYERYQCQHSVADARPDMEPTGTRRESKEERKNQESKTLGAFEEFWKVYPSRGKHPNPKKPARLKFDAAVKRGVDPNEIVSGARRFAQQIVDLGTAEQFVTQALTWLNQERWLDVPASNGIASHSNELPFGGGPPGPAPTLEELKVRMERSNH